MTTAPDLPSPVAIVPPRSGAGEAAVAAQPVGGAEAARPLLAVVPVLPDEEEIPFETALARALPRLRGYAARRLGNDHEAEEVVQEAMLRAFQHREKLATEDELMAWLTVVTGRLVIDRVRVRGRSTPVAELPVGARTAKDTADVVVARDEARIALDALEAMPGRQASVLWAREIEGLSYDEIGARFAMSGPSVRSLLHRARQTLRREYAARGGSLPAVGLIALAPWLRGLRHAGRLHRVVRHGVLTGAIAATGFIAVAGSPLTISPARHHVGHPAPATAPAVHVQTHRAATRAGTVTGTAIGGATTAAARQASLPATGQQQFHRLPTPAVCGDAAAGHRFSVGCSVPREPMLRVHLPVTVAGKNSVGVTNNNINCADIPTTPLTDCTATSHTQRTS